MIVFLNFYGNIRDCGHEIFGDWIEGHRFSDSTLKRNQDCP